MNEGAVAVAIPERAGGLSQTERLVDTFMAPTKTFADVLRSTSWWVPFLLLVVVSLGVTATVDRQVGFDRVSENLIRQNPAQEAAMASLTPEQRAARMHISTVATRYVSYGFPVLALLFSSIAALGLWGTFNFGLGARTTFGQMLCLWLYTSLPKLLGGLVTVALLFFGGDAENFNLKDPVGTNVGYYLPDAPAWLKAGLGFIDVLSLWQLALLVVGTAIVAKVSTGKAAAVVVGWWVVLLVLSMASTAAFS